MELALREALALGHEYVGTEHVLLALVGANEGIAAQVLLDFDADADTVRKQIVRTIAGHPHDKETRLGGSSRSAYEVTVVALHGKSDTWPAQLRAQGEDGWALVTIVLEGDRHSAVLQRRA